MPLNPNIKIGEYNPELAAYVRALDAEKRTWQDPDYQREVSLPPVGTPIAGGGVVTEAYQQGIKEANMAVASGAELSGQQAAQIDGVVMDEYGRIVSGGNGVQVMQAGFGEELAGVVAGAFLGDLFGGGEPVSSVASDVVPWTGGGTIANGVPISGPGVPEPPAAMVAKAWKTKAFSNTFGEFWVYHWKLIDGRCMTYNGTTKSFKIWRPKKHIVISSNPRIKSLGKLDRVYKRMQKMVKKYAPKQPKQKAFYQAPYLSAIEKKALKG